MPKKQPGAAMQRAINAIVLQAQASGIRNFVLAMKVNGQILSHLQEIPMNDAVNVIIASFHQALILEEKRSVARGPAYFKALEDARKDLNALVLRMSKAIEALPK